MCHSISGIYHQLWSASCTWLVSGAVYFVYPWCPKTPRNQPLRWVLGRFGGENWVKMGSFTQVTSLQTCPLSQTWAVAGSGCTVYSCPNQLDRVRPGEGSVCTTAQPVRPGQAGTGWSGKGQNSDQRLSPVLWIYFSVSVFEKPENVLYISIKKLL